MEMKKIGPILLSISATGTTEMVMTQYVHIGIHSPLLAPVTIAVFPVKSTFS